MRCVFNIPIPRLMWDSVIVLTTVYNCVVVPLRVTFLGTGAGALFGIDMLMCALYAADVAANLNTGGCSLSSLPVCHAAPCNKHPHTQKP